MKKISAREKTLILSGVVIALALVWQRAQRNQKDEEFVLRNQLRTVLERVEQSRALMAVPPPQITEVDRKPAAANDITMKMLKDLTAPTELKDLNIQSVDKVNPTDFKLIVDGKFGGLMRFLSYLERPESDFRVNRVDIGKAPPQTTKEDIGGDAYTPPDRRLRGTFSLSRRT